MEEKDNLSITLIIEYNISLEMLDDFIVTAFEGGINYWCGKVRIKNYPPNIDDKSDEAHKMLASSVLTLGGEIVLFDAESDDQWILTRPDIIKGIKMRCEDRKITPEGLYDSYDVDDVDAIVQYAIFNEITFS